MWGNAGPDAGPGTAGRHLLPCSIACQTLNAAIPILIACTTPALHAGFSSCALQLRGHRVRIVEKRRVEGRLQEWNVSRQELQVSDTRAAANMVR